MCIRDRQVTLQVNDEKEIKPLKEVVESLSSSSTAQLSSKEIDYSRALLQTETKEVGKQKVQIHRLSIPRGETFKVVLSDGTEVFLNSDSRLAYPTVFKGKERVVSLEGEAYFKVTKDAKHPFIVKSGNLQVRVLGTEFNVRSYSPIDVRVTLITGKVAVSDTCGIHSVEMMPGQSAQLSSDGTFAVNEVDIESFLYWKEGFFYFDDVALVDMMKEIGRWYNIDIEFRNSKIMDLRMHFFANRHQDIFHLIELLNRMERIHAHFETGKLISVCIIAYFAVAVYALQLDAAWKFWMMATFVGVFQGAIQALSRSYYAKIIPKEKSSEYFGIFDIFGKGASFMGTMLMGISTQIFDTSKAGVVVIAAMFVVGFVFFQVQRRTETQDSGTISSFAGSQKQLENI